MLFVVMLISAGHTLAVGADSIPLDPAHYRARVAEFEAQKAVTGKVILIGDELAETSGWPKGSASSTWLSRGIRGDNTYGLIARVNELARLKPSAVIVMIGMNDLAGGNANDRLLENIFLLVSRLRATCPGARIAICSILPVNPQMKGFDPRFKRQEDRLQINAQLRKYSQPLKYEFLDIGSGLEDQHGNLTTAQTTDGVHLSAAGYEWIHSYLRKNNWL